jgi:monothiol glutaredoxin
MTFTSAALLSSRTPTVVRAGFSPIGMRASLHPTSLRTYATLETTGTDPDFAPKAKKPVDNEETLVEEAITEMKKDIVENAVVLFMKGRPKQPQCGFSARVVQILSEYDVKYISYDVMADPYVRAGVKKIADWPTIPQLFVNGEFVGGCDIVMELHKTGELKKLLDPHRIKK